MIMGKKFYSILIMEIREGEDFYKRKFCRGSKKVMVKSINRGDQSRDVLNILSGRILSSF